MFKRLEEVLFVYFRVKTIRESYDFFVFFVKTLYLVLISSWLSLPSSSHYSVSIYLTGATTTTVTVTDPITGQPVQQVVQTIIDPTTGETSQIPISNLGIVLNLSVISVLSC